MENTHITGAPVAGKSVTGEISWKPPRIPYPAKETAWESIDKDFHNLHDDFGDDDSLEDK